MRTRFSIRSVRSTAPTVAEPPCRRSGIRERGFRSRRSPKPAAFAAGPPRRHQPPDAVRSRPVRRPAVKDIAIVLALSWLARALFVAAIGDAHSLDVGYWEAVLQAQDEGVNPYVTGVLNWPPLWLVVIVTVDFLAGLVDVSFWSALRAYLVLVESLLVVTLYLTLVRTGAERFAVRRALVAGIALNPVAIILVCQHGNSDVQVGFLVTLAIAALISHWRSRDAVLWLCGCLLVGLAILAKTAPLVLAPILAPGARAATRVGRVLGGVLLLGPGGPRRGGDRSSRPRRGVGSRHRLPLHARLLRALGDGVRARAGRHQAHRGHADRAGARRTSRAPLAPLVARRRDLTRAEVRARRGGDRRGRALDPGGVRPPDGIRRASAVRHRLHARGRPPRRVAGRAAVARRAAQACRAVPPRRRDLHDGRRLRPGLRRALRVLVHPLARRQRTSCSTTRGGRLLRIAWIVAAVTYGVEYAFIPFLGAFAPSHPRHAGLGRPTSPSTSSASRRRSSSSAFPSSSSTSS